MFPEHPGVIPEHRANAKPWGPLGVAQKQIKNNLYVIVYTLIVSGI